jgi:16S rRNA (cytosine967-C5)-methyltransferase
MKPGSRIQAAIEVLELMEATWEKKRSAPMDAILNEYFKARRYIGSKDRGAIAALVYEVTRNGGAIQWHLEQMNRAANPRRVVMAALILIRRLGWEEVSALFTGEKYAPARLDDAERGTLQKLEDLELHDPRMQLPVRYNFPDWMTGRLEEAFGEALPEAMQALSQEAPVDLRVNTLKCPGVAELIHALDKEGYTASPTPHSPVGVRLHQRFAAFNTQAFKDGWFEMQDEGSQIAALLVEAKPGEKVIDFCAGAGGKTLAIAATMQNKGRILAWDSSAARLKQMQKRLARAGVSNVVTHVLTDESDPFIKRHKDSADWVVVDAPCSGSGTWRRNPDLKWRFTPEDLQEVKALQASILASAARLVRPGGRLVYITCSVFADENLQQVKQFIETHARFKVAPVGKIWNTLAKESEGGIPHLRLSPHEDGTDGFFAVVLTRQSQVP